MAASAQTLTTATDALRRFQDDFKDAVYRGTVLLDHMKRRQGKLKGRELTFPIHMERNWGIGPRPETGGATATFLPPPGSQGYDEGTLTPVQYYGRFKITGVALARAKNNGAVVDLMFKEMDGVKKDLLWVINKDLYGDGSGKLAIAGTGATSDTLPVDTTEHLEVGMPIVLCASDGSSAVAAVIKSVDSETQVTLVASTTWTTADIVVLQGISVGTTSDVAGNACAGLETIVNKATGSYAGIDRAAAGYNGFFDAVKEDGSAGLSLDFLTKAKNAIFKKAATKPTLHITSEPQWRAYGNLLYPDRRWIDKVRLLDGGWEALEFGGVPVVWDPDCANDRWYMLDTAEMWIDETEPLHFIDYMGAILTQVGSGATAEDAYEATAKWTFNFVCERPSYQGVITDLPYVA